MAFKFNPFTGTLDLVDGVAGLVAGFTDGSVIFVSAGTLSQDNANFFYDKNNQGLGLGATSGFTSTLKLRVLPGVDGEAQIGNVYLGFAMAAGSGVASFSHFSNNSITNFAMAQLADGTTYFNCASGTAINLSVGFGAVAQIVSGAVVLTPFSNLQFNGSIGGYTQIATPSSSGSYVITLPIGTSAANNVMLSTAGGGVLNFGKVPVASIASLTASRIVTTDGSGNLSVNAALIANSVVYSNGSNVLVTQATPLNFSYDGTDFSVGTGKITSLSHIVATNGDVTGNDLFSALKGSAGSPCLSNTNDKLTGFYWPAARTISLSANGAKTMSWTTSGTTASVGALDVPVGSAASPTYTFTGQTTDGIYTSASNKVSFSTNGTKRGEWTNNGLTLSSGVLDAPATTSNTVPIYAFTGNLGTGMGIPATNEVNLIANAGTVLRANSTGVMLGSSTSPVGALNLFKNSTEVFWLTGIVSTTDNTQTVIVTFTTASNISYHLEADVIARRTGGTLGTAGDSAAYKILGFVKNVAGTLTLSTLTVSLSAEDQVLCDATYTISGTAIRVSITGTVSNNFNWSCLWKLVRV